MEHSQLVTVKHRHLCHSIPIDIITMKKVFNSKQIKVTFVQGYHHLIYKLFLIFLNKQFSYFFYKHFRVIFQLHFQWQLVPV